MAVRSAPAQKLTKPGALSRWSVHDGRSLVAEFEAAAISVTPLGPGTIHVRSSPTGEFATRRPWAPSPPDEAFSGPPLEILDEGESVTALLPELAVAIGNGGRVSVLDRDGRPILTDEEGPRWHEDGSRTWTKRMPDGERYYGFGERLGQLDKRGRRYTCWTTDEWRHQGPTTDELYVAVPFFMGLKEGRAYGVLLDNTFRTAFDLTDIAGRLMCWHADGGELDWYLFAGPEPARVVERLSELVGRMPLPPMWAIGFHQSRWGYDSAEEILDIAREFRAREIPADSIHLDIDHMSARRVFTWDEERFADPEGLVRELDELGFETTVVVSACVKQEPGYAVYDTGRELDVFLRRPDGDELTAYVWPGVSVFPDHVRPEVRRWWAERYSAYLDVGVRGFVNDMNEPAMHDTPVDEEGSRNIEPPLDVVHGRAGEQATHAEVRNLYALLEAEGTYSYLREVRPDQRPFLLSRSGYAGIQNYAGTWTGDLSSVWEHLEASLPEIVGLGLSGIPFAGADVGGFFESCGPELLVRWTQLGALMPFARNHSAEGTASQEPWAWGQPYEDLCRSAIEQRYRLLPYLYTLLEEASRTGHPVVRPLFFHYPHDEATYELSDQALLGRDLLLAPVVRQGVRARAVYFPEGEWIDLRDGCTHVGPDWSLASAALEDGIPVYARAGSIVPFGPLVQTSRGYRLDPLELLVVPADGYAEGRLYEDDGRTTAHQRGEWCSTTFRLSDGELSARREGAYATPTRTLRVVVPGEETREVRVGGEWAVRL